MSAATSIESIVALAAVNSGACLACHDCGPQMLPTCVIIWKQMLKMVNLVCPLIDLSVQQGVRNAPLQVTLTAVYLPRQRGEENKIQGWVEEDNTSSTNPVSSHKN